MDYFLPFYPTNSPKKNFWKNENNAWRYHHFTYVYQTLWPDDLWFLRYGAWWIYLFFILGYFLPFYRPNSLENQNLKRKHKKCLEISSFYICVPKIMIRWCMVPEIWCLTDVIVISHFGLFFALLPLWRYHHFTYLYQKLWSDDVQFLSKVRSRWTDRRTQRQTDGKSDI